MKYKVNDVITIRCDLSSNDRAVTLSMVELKGMKARIIHIYNSCYLLDIDNDDFLWSDNMFMEINNVPENHIMDLM